MRPPLHHTEQLPVLMTRHVLASGHLPWTANRQPDSTRLLGAEGAHTRKQPCALPSAVESGTGDSKFLKPGCGTSLEATRNSARRLGKREVFLAASLPLLRFLQASPQLTPQCQEDSAKAGGPGAEPEREVDGLVLQRPGESCLEDGCEWEQGWGRSTGVLCTLKPL